MFKQRPEVHGELQWVRAAPLQGKDERLGEAPRWHSTDTVTGSESDSSRRGVCNTALD